QVKDDKLDPPVLVLPRAIKKDATWEVNSKVGTQTIKGTMKLVDDKNKIKIGETEFEAVFVEGKDLDIAGAKTTIRLWFDKTRGLVKQEFVLQSNDVVKLELSKFEEGK
ncbi:MAG: hypothetical protein K2V38_23360, partial [Gemmataceae bacterium]|nr:hypothetical protein [Gemmataceae bacterium]